MKFGEMLLKEGLITQDQLQLALERQVVYGGRIGTNLVELGLVKEEELTRLLSKYLRIESADADVLNEIPINVIKTIPPQMASEFGLIPFRMERKRLHVAMLDVKNVALLDDLKFKTGYDIIPYVVSEIRLAFALEKHYGIKRDLRYISIFEKPSETKKTEEPPPAFDLSKVKQAFIKIENKDDIAAILINESRKVATRNALFLVKGDLLEGWTSKSLELSGFSTRIEPNSTFTEVIGKRTYYRGPLLNVGGNKPLINLLGGTPQDCLVMPIGIREKTVALLYADNGNDLVLNANLNYLNTLGTMASLCFEILILRKKIMDL